MIDGRISKRLGQQNVHSVDFGMLPPRWYFQPPAAASAFVKDPFE